MKKMFFDIKILTFNLLFAIVIKGTYAYYSIVTIITSAVECTLCLDICIVLILIMLIVPQVVEVFLSWVLIRVVVFRITLLACAKAVTHINALTSWFLILGVFG